jgi:hypothetical protein
VSHTDIGRFVLVACELIHVVVRARLHGASFRATRSMRLEADWGIQRRMRRSCAHGWRWQLHVLPAVNGNVRAS